MNVRRATRLTSVGGLLAGMLVVAGPGITVADASPVAQCGQTIPITTIPNLAEGAKESNSNIMSFVERSNYALPGALPVDISSPSHYPDLYAATNQLNPGTIAAGTLVDSYMFYSDPVGTPTTNVSYSATETFNTPIVGVILLDRTLDATDSTVGDPATTYSKVKNRGLELGTQADQVELVSPNSIRVHLETSVDLDEVRVITAGTPGGATTAPPAQYSEVASDGGIFNFGSTFYGSEGGTRLNKPMVGAADGCGTPGYWTVASDGGIFSFGGAQFEGSTGNIVLNRPIVAMASTADGLGYWLFATDGGVFAFGDALFLGSQGAHPLNRPVVGGAADPSGVGYWMTASDGGIFAHGHARFFGSTGNQILNKPVVGMAATPDGQGYWLVASDGGVFSFGDARYFGSTGNEQLNKPIVAMKPTADGNGYWLFASDGGVFAFGDAPFLGSKGGMPLNQPIVGAF